MQIASYSGLFRSTFSMDVNQQTTAKNEVSHLVPANSDKCTCVGTKLKVENNLYCNNICFPPEMYSTIALIIADNLRFQKDVPKHCGKIYKSEDRRATITVYKTTSLIHVQGSDHVNWTNKIRELYEPHRHKKCAENPCQAEVEAEIPTVPKTVESIGSTSEPQSECSRAQDIDHSDCVGHDHEVSLAENHCQTEIEAEIQTVPKTVESIGNTSEPTSECSHAQDIDHSDCVGHDHEVSQAEIHLSNFSVPMASTPKVERYVPISQVELLLEKISSLSNIVTKLEEKLHRLEMNDKPSTSNVMTNGPMPNAKTGAITKTPKMKMPKKTQTSQKEQKGRRNVSETANRTDRTPSLRDTSETIPKSAMVELTNPVTVRNSNEKLDTSQTNPKSTKVERKSLTNRKPAETRMGLS